MEITESVHPTSKAQYKQSRSKVASTVFERLYSVQPRQNSRPPEKQKSHSNLDRSQSPFKIEVKLHQRQALSSRRIEELRKKKEEEELLKLKAKPTINRRSQELAQRAEQKFFESYTVSYTDSFMKKTAAASSPFTQRKPSRSGSLVPSKVKQQPKKSMSISPFSNQISLNKSFDFRASPKEVKFIEKPSIVKAKTSPKKKRARNSNSFYYMTVLERNKYWIEMREQHLKQLKEDREKEELKDCTFNPVCYSKVPTMYQQFSPSQLKASVFISQNSRFDPLKASIFGSHMSKYESVYTDAVDSPSLLPMQSDYSPISPYQMQVSFQAGCDMGNFLRRREDN